VARGQQDIELLDPIQLAPRLLVFAWQAHAAASSVPYSAPLLATGGSHSFHWHSRNASVASVDALGLVRSTAAALGHTSVVVTDTRHLDIQARTEVCNIRLSAQQNYL
jgi:hypothetical protein